MCDAAHFKMFPANDILRPKMTFPRVGPLLYLLYHLWEMSYSSAISYFVFPIPENVTKYSRV